MAPSVRVVLSLAILAVLVVFARAQECGANHGDGCADAADAAECTVICIVEGGEGIDFDDCCAACCNVDAGGEDGGGGGDDDSGSSSEDDDPPEAPGTPEIEDRRVYPSDSDSDSDGYSDGYSDSDSDSD
jgi:hypothetical protein